METQEAFDMRVTAWPRLTLAYCNVELNRERYLNLRYSRSISRPAEWLMCHLTQAHIQPKVTEEGCRRRDVAQQTSGHIKMLDSLGSC